MVSGDEVKKQSLALLGAFSVLSIPAMANEGNIVLPNAEVVSAQTMNQTSGGLVFANGFDLSAGPIVSIGDFFQFPSAFFVSDDFYTEAEIVELTETVLGAGTDLVDVAASGLGEIAGSLDELIGGVVDGFLGEGIPLIPFF